MESDRLFGMKVTNGRWIYVILCMIINLCLGSVYSYSVFKGPLEDLWGITSTQSNFPFMIFLAFFAILMPFAGKFIDKFGPRNIMITGGAIVGIGWILSSFATNIWLITLTYGVIAGAGVGIAYGGPIAVATKWFPDKKGLAVGLALTGFGLSAFVTSPIARNLINEFGPLQTFGYKGIAFLIISIILSIPMKFPDKKTALILDTNYTKIKTGNEKSISVREMFRNPKAYALWICYTFGTTSGLMAIGISSPVARDTIGMTADKAAALVALFAVFNGVGRPLFGWLTDKITPKNASILSFVLILSASIGMMNAKEGSTIIYISAFIAFWLCLGGWLAIAPTATASFFGMENYAEKYGIMYSAYGVGAIVGGIISGQAKDVFGCYTYSFMPIAIIAIIGILISVMFLKNK